MKNLTIKQIIKKEGLKEEAKEKEKVYPIVKYNKNNNEIYFENSNGSWYKKKYDKNNNKIYYENSEGYWWKKEGNNVLKFENNIYYLNDKELIK